MMIPCVGAIVHDDAGRLLLIRRGNAPGAGLWSLPGGRVEPGEDDETALVREVHEETQLRVRVGRLVGTAQRPGEGGTVFGIRDYAASVTGGTLVAGDDADDARWVTYEEMTSLPLTEGLLATLTQWDVAPASADT